MLHSKTLLVFSCHVAYWIAHSAMKVVYDDDDGFEKSAFDISVVRDAIYTKFNVSEICNYPVRLSQVGGDFPVVEDKIRYSSPHL